MLGTGVFTLVGFPMKKANPSQTVADGRAETTLKRQ
jgi:hypothetical protein